MNYKKEKLIKSLKYDFEGNPGEWGSKKKYKRFDLAVWYSQNYDLGPVEELLHETITTSLEEEIYEKITETDQFDDVITEINQIRGLE